MLGTPTVLFCGNPPPHPLKHIVFRHGFLKWCLLVLSKFSFFTRDTGSPFRVRGNWRTLLHPLFLCFLHPPPFWAVAPPVPQPRLVFFFTLAGGVGVTFFFVPPQPSPVVFWFFANRGKGLFSPWVPPPYFFAVWAWVWWAFPRLSWKPPFVSPTTNPPSFCFGWPLFWFFPLTPRPCHRRLFCIVFISNFLTFFPHSPLAGLFDLTVCFFFPPPLVAEPLGGFNFPRGFCLVFFWL